MRAGLFWLNERQWACIAPHLPKNLTGPERNDDRQIISGIIHMLQCGARWRDCLPGTVPIQPSTISSIACSCGNPGGLLTDTEINDNVQA
jgi:transposase